MKKRLALIILLLCATLFGLSYISISKIGGTIPPFTVNTIRYSLGLIALLPFVKKVNNKKELFVGSFLTALTLVIAPFIHQYVAPYVLVAKMGFISAMYAVFTPLISFIFLKKKYSKGVIFSIFLAIIGLYILCGVNDLSLSYYDALLLIVALAFALEIIFIDKYAQKIDPTTFMFYTFIFVIIIDITCALLLEDINYTNITTKLESLLFLGIGCTGVAYSFQAIGQKYLDATFASIIMCLDSVISTIAGYFLLNQVLTIREIIGCIIMFIAVIICSVYSNKK